MRLDVNSAENLLLVGCMQLGHGVLYPTELVPESDLMATVQVHASQFKLIESMRELGFPREITVANGLPQWAIFEIKLEAGTGHKRIKLN